VKSKSTSGRGDLFDSLSNLLDEDEGKKSKTKAPAEFEVE